jgi:hypothetical protein
MSFLDNLEDNLKSLENLETGGIDESRRRDAERERTLAAAPWAERLKSTPFAPSLMQQATAAGYKRRIKVNLMWIGTSLRLEARGHRLELRPEPRGVVAVFSNGNEEVRRQPVNLAHSPQKLVAEWMPILDEQKRLDDEQAALALPDED